MGGDPSRKTLRGRYAVPAIQEDAWHTVSGERVGARVSRLLARHRCESDLLLNAGSGAYQLGVPGWKEISLDLFEEPLAGKPAAVCANVERLPFGSGSFGAVVCVGEVLGYCDPFTAISEFARVLTPNGMLLCDFGSTFGAKHWFKETFGVSATLVTDEYNNRPEILWNYSPRYILNVLRECGFGHAQIKGVHGMSGIAARVGTTKAIAANIERSAGWLLSMTSGSDLVVINVRRA